MPQRPFLRSRIATRHRTPHVAGTARPDTSCGNPRTWHTDRSSALGTRDQNRASSASLIHLSSLDSNQDFGDFPRNPLKMSVGFPGRTAPCISAFPRCYADSSLRQRVLLGKGETVGVEHGGV